MAKSPSRNPSAVPLSPTQRSALRALAALLAAVGGGWLGLRYGDHLGYALADLVGRDVAELKDTLIWGIVASGAVGALAACWLALTLTGAGRLARRAALAGTIVAAFGGTGLMAMAYDWPKSAGTPVIDYEIIVPAGVELPADTGQIRLAIWSGTSGQGCAITRVDHSGARQAFAGTIVLNTDNDDPVLTLQFGSGAKRSWRLPYTAGAGREQDFRPWQTIAFIEGPAAEGQYEIRYRLRRFM